MGFGNFLMTLFSFYNVGFLLTMAVGFYDAWRAALRRKNDLDLKNHYAKSKITATERNFFVIYTFGKGMLMAGSTSFLWPVLLTLLIPSWISVTYRWATNKLDDDDDAAPE